LFYLLKPFLELCGYKALPFALYHRQKQRTFYFNKEQFQIIYGCDGQHDLKPEEMTEKQKLVFEELIKQEWIAPCEEGQKLLPKQQYRCFPNYSKETVHWSITGDCNFRCRHCFMSAPDARFGVPTTEQLLNMIPQFEACGIRTAGLTGGEPLIRPDFFTIVDALTAHGIDVNPIYTNGALVTDELLSQLEKRNLRPTFQLSYDGPNGMHDWLRGIDGAEEMALAAMKRIREHGFRFTCAMVLHKKNKQDLRLAVRKLGEYGCSALKINTPYAMGCWVENADMTMPLEEYLQTLLDYIPQYQEDGMPIDIMLESYFMYNHADGRACVTSKRNATDDSPLCGAMMKNIYLSPDGKVLPCMSMIGTPIADLFPNAFETPLQEILTSSVYTELTRCHMCDLFAKHPECAACAYKAECGGGCRSRAVGGGSMDFLKPEQDLCTFYKNGWYSKFSEAIDRFNEAIGAHITENENQTVFGGNKDE